MSHTANVTAEEAVHGLSAAQRRFLEGLLPEGDRLFSAEETLVFGTDASRKCGTPLAVVRPTTEAQVVELLRWADAERLPVYPRARATNVVGGCVPQRPGIVLSTLRMARIIDIDEHDFVAVVQPGVITADLQRAVEARGLFYPPDPASQNISSIGGNVATCAGGMRAVRYGVTRDYVLGLRAVLPGGEVLATGSRCHKNVVGLDLVRLLVGSEGTLGCLTEVTLKLLPLPEATASLLAGFSDLGAAMDAVRNVFAAGILPVALEFMGPEVLDCAALLNDVPWPKTVRAALLFRLDGSRAALPLEVDRLAAAVRDAAPVWSAVGVGRDEEEPLWTIRRSINPASFLVKPDKMSDGVTVPRGRLREALEGIRAIAEARSLTILTFGHVGDGNIHVNIMHDASVTEEREHALAAKGEVTDLILSLGGTLSGEHGVGLTKAPYVHRQLSKLERGLMAQVKVAFDPHGIMNPGKAY